jgi:hypothetical protein
MTVGGKGNKGGSRIKNSNTSIGGNSNSSRGGNSNSSRGGNSNSSRGGNSNFSRGGNSNFSRDGDSNFSRGGNSNSSRGGDSNRNSSRDGDSNRNSSRDGDSNRLDGSNGRSNQRDSDTKKRKKNKMLQFCGSNPKICTGGIVAAGFAAYVGNKYKNLKEDEKKCLERCYPNNWAEYVEGVDTEPLYKSTKDPLQFALLDDEIKEELENELCNKDNLTKKNIPESKTSCDEFCKDTCKATFSKAFDESISDVGRGAGDLSKGFMESIKKMFEEFLKGLGIDPKMIIFGFIGFILLIIVINLL